MFNGAHIGFPPYREMWSKVSTVDMFLHDLLQSVFYSIDLLSYGIIIYVLTLFRPPAETKKALASALINTFPCLKDSGDGSGFVSTF